MYEIYVIVMLYIKLMQIELESWDMWISDDKVGMTHTASRYSNRFPGKKPTETEVEPEVDYFQELQLEPSISKTKKVRI